MRRYLFTYGTLMSGRKRNEILKKLYFQYVSDANMSGYILKHYPLGDYPVILKSHNDNIVNGEIWAFPSIGEQGWDDAMAEKVLEILDQIEGVGNLYTRCMTYSGSEKKFYFYAGIPEVWRNQPLVDAKLDGKGMWTGGVDIAF